MCGLVGVAGNLSWKHEKMFNLMLQLDTVRGSDSTGALVLRKSGATQLAKCVGTPWELEQDYTYKGFSAGLNVLMLGHNRAATKGAVTRKAAHPFEFENLIGAHNGTLTTWNKLKDHSKFTVDSEALYYHMNSEGVYDTLRNMTGAYALTWYDKQEGSLNFLRNDKRTLHYCYDEDDHVLMWASEPWMLQVAAAKNNIKVGEIMSFPELKHCKLTIDTDVPARSPMLSEMRVREVKHCVPKSPTYTKGAARHTPGASKNTGTNGNVSKFPQTRGATTPSPTLQKQAGELVGKTVTFVPERINISGANNTYVMCKLPDHPAVPLRVFKGDPYLFDELCDSLGKEYQCEIKRSVVYYGDTYVAPDNRSIMRLAGEEETDTLYEGPNGEFITEAEFKTKVGNGCAFCGSPVNAGQHLDVLWLTNGNVVCPECKEIDEVKDYVN